MKTDFFGIGNGVLGVMRSYFTGSRSTGRTNYLVESAMDGDIIIFSNAREAARVEHLCGERGISIKWAVVDPKKPQEIASRVRGRSGRITFDHTWIEEFYIHEIEKCSEFIDHHIKNGVR